MFLLAGTLVMAAPSVVHNTEKSLDNGHALSVVIIMTIVDLNIDRCLVF